MAARRPKLYVMPGSHPCAVVEAALVLKSIPYDRVDLLPVSQILIGPLRYGGTTVPGMRLNGERLFGSRTILRRLDALVAEPALLPVVGSPEYARVLEAERWGEVVFQGVPRRIIDLCFIRRPYAMMSYAGDSKLPVPLTLTRPFIPLTARLMAFKNEAREDAVRVDLSTLGAMLERIDGWIADGLLGGERPNAADLQIGSTVRLLMSIGDVRPLVRAHAASELTRYFPPMVGEVEAGVLSASLLHAPASA